MFCTVEISDSVRIALLHDREAEVRRMLEQKYIGNALDGGICILLMGIVSVDEYRVSDEFLVARTRFSMLLFKFFRNEIVHGRIVEQSESGMRLGMPFFSALSVQRSALPVVSENVCVSDGKEHQSAWVWIYKSSRLYFRKDDEVRFRVGDARAGPQVACDLSEMGLGPLSWWR